jgi:hypothetical protein
MTAPDVDRLAPEIDYRRTSERPAFAALPDEVQDRLADCAGSPVAFTHPPVRGGFTRAYAGRLVLADGRTVFAKAAGAAAPHARRGIEVESAVLARLGGRATAPRLVGAGGAAGSGGPAGEGDEWRMVVMEAIEGDMPGMPWTPAAAEAAHRACLATAALDPSLVAELTTDTLAQDLGGNLAVLAVLESLGRGTAPWPAWLPRLPAVAMAELVRLAHGASTALAGDRLVHGDLRPDNLLVDRHGAARMVDWNWVSRGPAWVDFVGLWPLMAFHGVDVSLWQDRSPLLAAAAPDHIDAFLAIVVGLMVHGAAGDDTTPGLALLRAHQRFTARTFLALLGARRGWS